MNKTFGAVLGLSAVLGFASSAHAQTTSLAPPWQFADVGAVGTPGSAQQSSSFTITVSGAGSDIWGRPTASRSCINRSAMAEWTLN